MIRKSALIVLAIFALLTGGILWLGKNGYVESLAEYSLESMFHAKVEFQGLSVNPIDLEVAFSGLQIANKNEPMSNLVQMGPSRFQLELMPLFAGKVVIKQMTVSGLQTNTPRSSSGELARFKEVEQSPEQSKSAKEYMADLKTGMDKVNLPVNDFSTITRELQIDRVVNPDGLASVKKIDETKLEAEKTISDWEVRVDQLTYEQDLADLQQRIEALQSVDTQDLMAVKEGLEELKSIQKDSKKLLKDMRQTRDEANSDFSAVREQVNNLQDEINEDIAAAKRLANLGELGAEDAGKLLFGRAMMARFNQVLEYVAMARSYIPEESEEEAPPERRKGRNVHYAVTGEALPDFLLRKAALAGSYQGKDSGPLAYSGELKGLSSQPRIYRNPVTLDMELEQENDRNWQLDGLFDHRSDEARDEISIQGTGLNLDAVDLKSGDKENLPSHFTPQDARVDIKLALVGDQLDAGFMLDASTVRFDFSDEVTPNADMQALFADFDHVTLEAGLKGDVGAPDLVLQSNIDKKFSERVKAMFGEKVKEAEAKIRAAIEEQVNAKRAEYQQYVEERMAPLQEKLDGLQQQYDEQKAALEARKEEFEKGVKKEKKKQKNKLKDSLLKGL